jgi:uridine kinase
LYGPAGAGKSAILQSLAEQCYSLEGHFGGSFFFSRGKPGRNQGHFLFSTIAYQLATNLPYLQAHINSAMQANPALYTKSMVVQMHSLIIDSFQKLSESIEHTPIVIVDGLDECDDHETQQLILEIIYEAVAQPT